MQTNQSLSAQLWAMAAPQQGDLVYQVWPIGSDYPWETTDIREAISLTPDADRVSSYWVLG